MKKLSLEIQDLAVESFETDAAEEPRGTVEAREFWTQLKTNCTQCMTLCIETCVNQGCGAAVA
jgi:hypothetical protein